MNNNNCISSQIGLVQDFSDLFADISQLATTSDNWFQQYQSIRDLNKLHLQVIDEMLVSSLGIYHNNSSVFSTKQKVLPLSNEEFANKYKPLLWGTIKKSPINNGEESEATSLFAELLAKNKITTLHIINDLFINYIDDELVCVKLLSLCNDYSYDDLFPTAQTLASLSISHKSKRVKSAAMNLFSHWGTKEAYKLLCSIECPNDPWIQMKFNTIKKSLEGRWYMQEK